MSMDYGYRPYWYLGYPFQPCHGTFTWNGYPPPLITWTDELAGRDEPAEQPRRWMESLIIPRTDDPAELQYGALTYLALAMVTLERGGDPSAALAHAGGHVVAWRKSLDEQGKRMDPPAAKSAKHRIASCIGDLAWIDLDGWSDSSIAIELRGVEAQLRQLWEEQR